MSIRGVSPVVGTVLMILVVVSLTAVVGAATYTADPNRGTSPGGVVGSAPELGISVNADSAQNTVVVVHERGEPIDVRDIDIRITVNGDPIPHQPTVPAVGIQGFRGTPSGPFNAATDSTWTAGESASLTVAGANAAAIQAGDRLTVTISMGSVHITDASTSVR